MAKRRLLKHTPRTVCLVGMGPSLTCLLSDALTQEFMPDFADEVWAINMAANVVRHDVVIWADDLDQQEKFKPGLFACLRRWEKPVITTKADRVILPHSYDFPINEMVQIGMPIFGKPYMNNGVAMAIAYAMAKGVRRLKMYGCDFTYPDRNYAETGRACTEAWMALASASGMELVLPDKTSLFDAVEPTKGIYGYAEQPRINLPNGMIYNCGDHSVEKPPEKPPEKPAILEESGEYVAEDTRKDTHADIPRHVPRANGGTAPGARTA